ncbi:hypothetical protein GCM10023200_10430 [Actinomycetospora chlora]|uniref:Stress-response A/B barrel domain-containing protein n=1 Tax=Actinomycetospora chlora TaxID=663608 RepID=A0ABP9ACW2_9PSEU
MSVTHVVLFTWHGDAAADPAVVEGIADALRRFVRESDLPGLQSWTCGRDAGLAAGNAEFACVGVFDDVDAYTVYRDHPEHRRIIDEQIKPYIAERTAVQFTS